MKIMLAGLILMVLGAALMVYGRPMGPTATTRLFGPSFLDEARGVLAKDPKYARVTIEAPYEISDRWLWLSGVTETENEKFDAAVVLWTHFGKRMTALTNDICSSQFRDQQVSRYR